MPLYRKFNKNDILFSTIHTRPRVSAKYGANGWEGTTGPSASLSLYGGVRSRLDVKPDSYASSGISIYPLDPLDTHSIDKVIFVSGSYPSTGSIRFVRCTNVPYTTFTQVNETRWYEEHFRPIERLFEHYGRFDSNYYLGSTDAYIALLLADSSVSTHPGSYFSFLNVPVITGPTSSFTAEVIYKPLSTASSPVVMGQQDVWSMQVGVSGGLYLRNDKPNSLFITGSNSVKVREGVYNHLAMVVSGGVSVTFYVNGVSAGTAAVSTLLTSSLGNNTHPFIVGALRSGSTTLSSSDGFVFETRLWRTIRTPAQLAASASGTMLASSSADLVHYARFNDGPLAIAHGAAMGSGAFDYSVNANHGTVSQYSNQQNVHWQPSDHPTFMHATIRSGSSSDIRLFHVPSMFYGRQIDPGSVRVTDGLYNSRRIVRVLNDDGRGTLYVSGSMTRDISGEEYTGEKRRKVGNVFYTEGLVVITDPTLWDMFDTTSALWQTTMTPSGVFGDLLALDFRGQSRVHTKVFNCRVTTAQANASNNLTFGWVDNRGTDVTDDDRMLVVREDGTTWITAVGLYNEHRELVAVAKLAQPIRKREKDKINIRLKMDF